MAREILISIIIIIMIFLGNFLLERHIEEKVGNMSNELVGLKSEIIKNKENVSELIENFNNVNSKWDKTYSKLAYYIEHNELEKIESDLTGIKSYIELGNYEESINKVDSSIFWLRHIKEKYKFNLVNIF